MRRVLSSYRWRRRLLWFGGAAVLAAVVVGGALLIGDTGRDLDLVPRKNDPAVIVREPKRVPATKAEKSAAYDTAIRFINSAVRRKNVSASWDIVTPNMRSGYSRRAWSSGDIPVVPYPAKTPRLAPWRVDYEHKNALGLVFWLLPEERSRDWAPMTFFLDLRASGKGKRREWRVDYFAPASANESAPSPGESASGIPRIAPDTTARGRDALGTLWLAVPLSVLGLFIAAPLVFALRGWYVGRRARRADIGG
ncbi:MAG: hypothetical protein ICV59_03010 [Thermoleophilia bacterium]|nr:hypothetical protein [Thermoleophilia bacterium]